MTVKELIEKLERYAGSRKVKIEDIFEGYAPDVDIEGVKLEILGKKEEGYVVIH